MDVYGRDLSLRFLDPENVLKSSKTGKFRVFINKTVGQTVGPCHFGQTGFYLLPGVGFLGVKIGYF